jgi:hypothetical protein
VSRRRNLAPVLKIRTISRATSRVLVRRPEQVDTHFYGTRQLLLGLEIQQEIKFHLRLNLPEADSSIHGRSGEQCSIGF